MFTGVEAIGPPGIGAGFIGIKITVRVDHSGGQHVVKFGTFFIGETGVTAVGLRILQVDLLMRDVEIAAVNNRLFLFQLFHVCKKVIFPYLPVGETGEIFFGIRHIDRDQVKIRILHRDHTALMVVFLDAKSQRHVQRFFFYEGCGA